MSGGWPRGLRSSSGLVGAAGRAAGRMRRTVCYHTAPLGPTGPRAPIRPRFRGPHGPLLRDLRQGLDGRLQPAVVGHEPRPSPPPLCSRTCSRSSSSRRASRPRRWSAPAAGARCSRPPSRPAPAVTAGRRPPLPTGRPRRPVSSCPAGVGAQRSSVSSQIVNGPSFTSSTAISAPNRPGRHRRPQRLEGRAEPLVEPLGQLRRRRAGEPGPATAARVREQRELRDDSASPPTSTSERFVRPSSSRKIRSSAIRRASAVGDRLVVAPARRPGAPRARARSRRRLAVDPDARAGRALEERPHALANGPPPGLGLARGVSRVGGVPLDACVLDLAGTSRS